MMDSFSITTDCIELGNTISRTSLVLNEFVRAVREARADLDAVSRELHSLQGVLDLLKEDAGTLPSRLAAHTPAVLEQCNVVVGELDVCLLALLDAGTASGNGNGHRRNSSLGSSLSSIKSQRRAQWVSVGRHRVTELRMSLEAHRGILGLAMDLVGTTSGRELHDSIEADDYDSIENEKQRAEVRNEVARIVAEMEKLQQRLPGEFGYDGRHFGLQAYYVVVKVYATSLMNSSSGVIDDDDDGRSDTSSHKIEDAGALLGEDHIFGTYEGDTPDSAIEVSDGSSSSDKQGFDDLAAAPAPSVPRFAALYIHEVDQLKTDMNMNDEDDDVDKDDDDDAESGDHHDYIESRAPTPPPKDIKRLEGRRRTMCSPFELQMPERASTIGPEHSQVYGVVTSISSQGRSKTTPSSSPSKYPSRTRSGRFLGRVFGHVKNSLSASETMSSLGSISGSASTMTEMNRPETPIIQASLVRRGSRRLSTSIKRLPLWTTELEELSGPTGVNTVFGVSLQKSMQAAKSTATTHHSGSGSSSKGGSSRREFPLCVHKCCLFLQREGVEAPDIFAEPGESYRVQRLKEVFSTAPVYGDDVDLANYGVYDAADIILIFLTQLPKPLVSESLAKRWVSLSRQATMSGSHATRLDQCIDFWEEALGGMRGPARSLFKLLLNLWSEIADAADRNDMTAERLAGVLLKPLMHTSSEKYSTDFMLGLAFLIRKRSEYIVMLNSGRKSRAAFEK